MEKREPGKAVETEDDKPLEEKVEKIEIFLCYNGILNGIFSLRILTLFSFSVSSFYDNTQEERVTVKGVPYRAMANNFFFQFLLNIY